MTAAVVGVILNLALWFGLHVSFTETRLVSGFGLRLNLPVLSSVDVTAALLTALALLAVFRLRMGAVQVLALCAGLGMILRLIEAV